jgi:flagellar hook-associated protein 2
MSGISFGGLASGLDTNSIIQKLVQLEHIPIDQLEAKKKSAQEKLTAVGKLKALVNDLKNMAKALSTSADFLVFDVKASQTGVASFSATGAAAPAHHTLTVNQLASVDRWAFDGVASATTNLASGSGQSVSFTVGGTAYDVAIDPANSTIENIASAINSAAGSAVTATVVNTGTASAPSHKLVLTSDSSGADGRISGISSSVSGLTIDGTGPDAANLAQSANNISVGTNAIAIIDGLEVERATNDFNDVIAGVSITAEHADPALTISFSAEANKPAIKKKVQDLVTAYNAVITFINQQNTFSKDAGAGGVLFGDSLLSNVRSQIHGALFKVPIATVQNDTTGFSTLGLIGVKTLSDGMLEIDSTKLDAKMSADLTAFADLFADSDGFDNGGAAVNTPEFYQDTTADSGLAATLMRSIDRMMKLATGSGGVVLKGLFDARNDTVNAQIRDIDKQIASKQAYIDKFEANLIARFAKLEELMGGLNSQGPTLQAGLSGVFF